MGAGCGIKAGEPLAVVEAGEVKEPAVANGRRGIAGADGGLPDDRRAGGGPFLGQAGLGRLAIARRAEEAGPIVCRRSVWNVGRLRVTIGRDDR